jgi:hypothetical protein
MTIVGALLGARIGKYWLMRRNSRIVRDAILGEAKCRPGSWGVEDGFSMTTWGHGVRRDETTNAKQYPDAGYVHYTAQIGK